MPQYINAWLYYQDLDIGINKMSYTTRTQMTNISAELANAYI